MLKKARKNSSTHKATRAVIEIRSGYLPVAAATEAQKNRLTKG